MRNSITARLFAAIAVLLIVAGAGTWLMAQRYGQRAAERAYDMLLDGAARAVARSATVIGGVPRVDLPVSAFELLSLAPDDRILYGVFGPDGATITGSDQLAEFDRAFQGAGDRAGGGARFFYATHRGEPIRLTRVTRELSERNFRGEITVIVGHTLIARNAMRTEIVSQALAIVVVAGSCIFLVAMLAIRASLSPLRRVEAELTGRDPTDLRPIRIRVPVEVRANVLAINRFMTRLSHRIDSMQALIADASHQLLTPITALSAYAQSAAAQKGITDRAVAEEVRSQSEEIAHLARQLIDQAMVIHRADVAPMQQLDLREVAIRAERAVQTYLGERPQQLWLNLPEQPAPIRGDDFSLIEAIKNLVANAFNHGAPPVHLVVEPRDDGARYGIFVEDRGSGIPEERWAQIGRRFDRRSGAGPRSHGLGLAIAAEVARAHRGRLVLERSPAGAFRCGLVLPRSRDNALPEAEA